MLAYAIVMSVYPICSTTSSEGDCRELQSLSSTDQAAFSLAKPRRVLTLQINKLWFGLAIFPALPICLSIECRSQLWKRTRGPSKELILYSVDIFLYKYSVCLHAWDAWFQIQWTIDPALPKALEEGGVFLRRWKLPCTPCSMWCSVDVWNCSLWCSTYVIVKLIHIYTKIA
jgi:hypothetical protein